MPEPIILGRITLYARVVDLDDRTKAFSVAMYSEPGNKCRVPFNQSPGIEGMLFVRPRDASVEDFKGSDPNGECGIGAPFLKYDLDDRVYWVAVNKAGVTDRRLQGSLSQILRQPIA